LEGEDRWFKSSHADHTRRRSTVRTLGCGLRNPGSIPGDGTTISKRQHSWERKGYYSPLSSARNIRAVYRFHILSFLETTMELSISSNLCSWDYALGRVVSFDRYGNCRCRVIRTPENTFIAQITTGWVPLLRRWRTVSDKMNDVEDAERRAREWAWATVHRTC
jgi:hypothetical protein